MKSYYKLKAKMRVIQQQMVKVKNKECGDSLSKYLSFSNGTLKDLITKV
jgi:hypothetical protein